VTLRWVNRKVRVWWPAILAVIGGAILATLGFVVSTVVDGRAEDRERNRQLATLVEQQAEIIERDRRNDEMAGERLGQAISEVEDLLRDHFARHDENVALKLNDMLARIAALLGRPAGIPVDPVTANRPPPHSPPAAAPAPSPSASAPPAAPAPGPRPTSTTTTRPDQRRCAVNPNHPRC
jgi:hypothetical protein